MDICEVYALNIQPQQLKENLPATLHTKEGMEEERSNFLAWLRSQQALGYNYPDQTYAWFWYCLYYTVTEEQPDEELDQLTWSEEIEERAFMEANTLENLGNYSFENRKEGGFDRLPAQK